MRRFLLLLAVTLTTLASACRTALPFEPHHPPDRLWRGGSAELIAGERVTVLAPEGRVREGAVAISPVNVRVAVIAGILNVPQQPAKVLVWRTRDGGATWTRSADVPLEVAGMTLTGHFDPVLAFDATGVAFLAAVGTTSTRLVTSINVFRSADGGATWIGVHARPVNGLTQDKPWIAIDDATATLHLIWGEFRLGSGGTISILHARSADSGASWSEAKEIATNVGWPFVAAAPGRVIASFADTSDSGYAVRVSSDNGATFGNRVPISPYNTCGTVLPDVGMHQLAADDSPRATRGHVYAVSCGRIGKTKGVAFTRSADGGATWSAPAIVSGDADIALPAVAVDDRTGDVVVAWIDGRHPQQTRSGRLYATRSRDGGATFDPPTALTEAFGVEGFIGDYNQLAASDGLALAVFSDAAGHLSVARIGEPGTPPPPPRPPRRRAIRH